MLDFNFQLPRLLRHPDILSVNLPACLAVCLYVYLSIYRSVLLLIPELKGLVAVEEWSKDLHIIRHGYHGRLYNGNNSKRILDNCERLREAFGFECYPAVDALKALGEVCSGEKKT